MKKIAIAAVAALIATGITAQARNAGSEMKKVVYLTSVDCEHCAKKVRENISFEKGVKDLKVDVQSQTVEISFDSAKTDTLTLRKSINKLGYKAEVIKYE